MLFLILNVLSNNGFIQPCGADTIAASPETMTIPWALYLGYIPMNPNRILPLRKPIPIAILYRGGALKSIWTWSGMPLPSNNSISFWRHNSHKIAPISWRSFPYNVFLRYYWYHYNMIFTIPFYTGLPLPVFHNGSPVPHAKPSSGEPLPKIRRKRLSLWDTHRHNQWFT